MLDKNISENERLRKQIGLLNELSPNAYSIANLPILEIFQALYLKEADPGIVWRNLNQAYGQDYFIVCVEE